MTDDDKDYVKNIEFIDIKLNIGDVIYAPDYLIKENNLYTYGPLLKDTSIEDAIKVIQNGKEIFLTRYYG